MATITLTTSGGTLGCFDAMALLPKPHLRMDARRGRPPCGGLSSEMDLGHEMYLITKGKMTPDGFAVPYRHKSNQSLQTIAAFRHRTAWALLCSSTARVRFREPADTGPSLHRLEGPKGGRFSVRRKARLGCEDERPLRALGPPVAGAWNVRNEPKADVMCVTRD